LPRELNSLASHREANSLASPKEASLFSSFKGDELPEFDFDFKCRFDSEFSSLETEDDKIFFLVQDPPVCIFHH